MPKRFYGYRPDTLDSRDVLLAAAPVSEYLPIKIDLRNEMPPIWDQGALSSCTSFSTAAQVLHKDKTNPVEPSRLFIYYNTRVLEGTVKYDSGATIRNSIKAVATYGFTPEVEWPYAIERYKTKPPKRAFDLAKKQRVLSYARVTQNLKSLQTCLVNGDTINFGFSVYAAFEASEVAETGIVALPKKNEAPLGGHAVLLVGYDNEKQMFIVRNSWGAQWGDSGYFHMPYAYVLNNRLATDFWTVKAVQ